MLELLRWTTLHPALVHLPLGILPLAALAYAMAVVRRSERWTFAADMALFIGAGGTVLAAGFGLVAYLVLDWPSGWAPWPVIHLALGASSTAAVVSAAVFRGLTRRRRMVASRGLAAISFLLVLAAAGTGWVGGEVLVFHGGAAVRAAGDGLLAPPVTWPEGPPSSVADAMGRLRSTWAANNGALTRVLVDRPTEPRFREVAENARLIQQLARWLMREGPELTGVGGAGFDDEEEEVGAERRRHGRGATAREHLRQMAGDLLARARSLEDAALHQDVLEVMHRQGELTAACAGCHQHLRWNRERD
ncbi:MAG: hypothetical protein HYZ28_02915 [Myxococcales bacterium]|nr:hypothetical protein [Myxococcales bacterium]